MKMVEFNNNEIITEEELLKRFTYAGAEISSITINKNGDKVIKVNEGKGCSMVYECI